MGQLKHKLCELASVSADEVHICKNALGRQEYKDAAATLEELQLFDGSAVYLKPGRPMGLHTYRFRIFLHQVEESSTPQTSDSPQVGGSADATESGVAAEDALTGSSGGVPPPPPPKHEAARLSAFRKLPDFFFDASCTVEEFKVWFSLFHSGVEMRTLKRCFLSLFTQHNTMQHIHTHIYALIHCHTYLHTQYTHSLTNIHNTHTYARAHARTHTHTHTPTPFSYCRSLR
jgi:hypothetical protein